MLFVHSRDAIVEHVIERKAAVPRFILKEDGCDAVTG